MSSVLPSFLAQRVARGRFDVQFHEFAALGVSEGQVRHWLRCGHLARVGGGSYLINVGGGATQDLWENRRENYLRRCGAILGGLPGAYLVGRSAAVAHGLPLLREPAAVHLARNPCLRTRRTGLVAHRPWGAGPVENTDDLPTQNVAETVVELSAGAGMEEGLVVADAALHLRLTEPVDLLGAIERFGTRRGVAYARRVSELADTRVESPGESRLRWQALELGYELLPQVEIRDASGRFVARVDFLLCGTRVVVEFDGMSKYVGPEVTRAEKVRQMELERLGYVVVRLRWSDLDKPGMVDALLRPHVRIAA